MSTHALEQAIAVSRGVLENVKVDQLGDSTPCAGWNVGGLIDHMVGANIFFSAGVAGAPPAGIDAKFSEGDYLAAYDEHSAACVAAFQGDGVMDKMLTLPFGAMPGSAFIGLAMIDTFTHAWDLAKATGQSTDLAPDLAATLLVGAKASIQPGFRSEDGAVFGMEKAAPSGASNADQLAAFLGRTV